MLERNYIIHDKLNIKGFFNNYRWLSNYHICDIYFEGLLYSSTENAYQAAKSLDPFIRQQIVLMTPHESKQFSHKIQVRPHWDEIKYDIMSAIVFDKFYRHLDLRQELLYTRNKYIEETNGWNDKFYGVCNNEGLNNLGKIIMGIRQFWQNKEIDKPVALF